MQTLRGWVWRGLGVLSLCACLGMATDGGADAVAQEAPAPLRFGDPVPEGDLPPFFPGSTYDPSVTPPDVLLGQQVGTRLAHPDEILDCFRRWAEESPRVTVEPYAYSHEGRELVRVVITSPANLERLDAILRDLDRLADPRGLDPAEAERLVAETPAVAWLGYSIHGDEASGSDASLVVGHHLAAGTHAAVVQLLEQVVVVLDPCMNPDGRERITTQVEQMSGRVGSLDPDIMQRGRWPYGRGNHYLFDMNRDWMAGTQPETRGRWRALRRFHPQLVVDAHEMGSLDTYLFYPQAAPHNPHLPEHLAGWQEVFGNDQGAAFDQYGWAYYTREWADAWAPFYSDAWASLNGAVGILYEQAGIHGFPLERTSGQVVTYRDTVHHHAVSSLANVSTLAAHREEILRDYWEGRRRNVDPEAHGNDRMFVLVPGRNGDREDALLGILLDQGVEVFRAREHFTGLHAVSTLAGREEAVDLPPGTWVVPAAQPQGPLVKTFLGLDIRVDDEALQEERESLERDGQSLMYDDTAWCLAQAFDLEGWWCDAVAVPGERILAVPPRAGRLVPPPADRSAVAWVVDGASDGAVRFAVEAMRRDVAVLVSDEPFRSGGRSFTRGSLLVRRNENEPDVAGRVAEAALAAQVEAYATASGRSPDDGPDLGGGHFELLRPPRAALVGNAPFSSDSFGHLWHWLDQEVGLPLAQLDAAGFGRYDLRRYNVLVLPPARGGGLADHLDALAEWVEAGGTLIACGSSAVAVARSDLSAVTLRRSALDEVEAYEFAARREFRARAVTVDPAAVWGDPRTEEDGSSGGEGAKAGGGAGSGAGAEDGGGAGAGAGEAGVAGVGGGAGARPDDGAAAGGKDADAKGPDAAGMDQDPDAERQDAWLRRFRPQGVFLRARVDDEHWITAGSPPVMPAFVSGSHAFLSREPVRTPVRLDEADGLRLNGLLWPEARQRLALTALVTVERRGQGQVILFHTMPAYRGYLRSTARMLANAVVYGPGLGASGPR